jgi:hypothetical protein
VEEERVKTEMEMERMRMRMERREMEKMETEKIKMEMEKAELRARQAEEQIAKQRAMDKAARAAAAASASNPTTLTSWDWFSKITQAASGVSSTITLAEEHAVPPKSTILRNSDMLSNGKDASSPNTEFCPLPGDGGRDATQHSSTPNPTPHEPASIHSVRSVMVTPSSASVVPSPFTIVSEEHKVINDKQDGNQFQLV